MRDQENETEARKHDNCHRLHVIEGPAVVCINGEILGIASQVRIGVPRDRVVDPGSENSDGVFANTYLVPRLDWVLDGVDDEMVAGMAKKLGEARKTK